MTLSKAAIAVTETVKEINEQASILKDGTVSQSDLLMAAASILSDVQEAQNLGTVDNFVFNVRLNTAKSLIFDVKDKLSKYERRFNESAIKEIGALQKRREQITKQVYEFNKELLDSGADLGLLIDLQ